MVVTGPTVVLVWSFVVVLTASFSRQLSEIWPAGPAPQAMLKEGEKLRVHVSLVIEPAGSVLVSTLSARFCVFWPVNAELGIVPKTFVMTRVLKSADSKTEEYCRLSVLPVPVATWRLIAVVPFVDELKLKLAKAPSWVNFIFVLWLAGTAGPLAFGITWAIISAGNTSSAVKTNNRFIL
jgi:hypothetical protein